MKSHAVAVVFVLLFLSTLIADGDCQRGRKRGIEVKVISANLRVPLSGRLWSS